MLFKQQLLEMGLVEDKDFIQQYYSKEKYPFFCDFYLVNPDIYIEINGTWEHGGHPFMSLDTDRETLDIWKSKIKDHPKYETAIFRWTIRDVDKRKTAEKNNLNFVELWSKDEINAYINYLKEEIYK